MLTPASDTVFSGCSRIYLQSGRIQCTSRRNRWFTCVHNRDIFVKATHSHTFTLSTLSNTLKLSTHVVHKVLVPRVCINKTPTNAACRHYVGIRPARFCRLNLRALHANEEYPEFVYGRSKHTDIIYIPSILKTGVGLSPFQCSMLELSGSSV